MSALTGEARAVQLRTPEGPVTVLGLEVTGTDGRFVVHRRLLPGAALSTETWTATHAPTGLHLQTPMYERDNAARIAKRAFDLLLKAGAPLGFEMHDWLGEHIEVGNAIQRELRELSFELEPVDPDDYCADACPDEEVP